MEAIEVTFRPCSQDEAVQMLSGKYIDYLTCAKVLDSLKDDKTVGARGWGGFGKFTNEHALRWKEIVDDYARGNIYLAEIAQMVQQAAVYDIPNAKKRLARLQTVAAPPLNFLTPESRTPPAPHLPGLSSRPAPPHRWCPRPRRKRTSAGTRRSSTT